MRQLSKYLLLILILLVALTLSGLRLALPHINNYKQQIVEKIEDYSGIPIKIGLLDASWESFGPVLEVHDISLLHPRGKITIQRMIIALDVFKSLLHGRWQLREVIVDHVDSHSNFRMKQTSLNWHGLNKNNIKNILLYQLDHLMICNSKIIFPSPSGARIQFDIPSFTFLKTASHYRGEGDIVCSTHKGQQGKMQVRIDLHDKKGLLINGQVYLKADEFALKPWLGCFLESKMGLNTDKFSLVSWLFIRHGKIQSGRLVLNHGAAICNAENKQHAIMVDRLHLQMVRVDGGFYFYIPQLNFSTDEIAWPKGSLSALYLPAHLQSISHNKPEELRIRATDLQLELIEPIFTTLSFLMPDTILSYWGKIHPKGHITYIGLDIPLQQPERLRFVGSWEDVSWQLCKTFPGISHFDGIISGSSIHAGLRFSLEKIVYPSTNVLSKIPLKISHASGYTSFIQNDQGWFISGDHLNMKANSLFITGDCRYQHPKNIQSSLSMLSGTRFYDFRQTWRSFQEHFMMGAYLVDNSAGSQKIFVGYNPSLVCLKNTHDSPHNNQEQCEIFRRLINTGVLFCPTWMPHNNLRINLDFLKYCLRLEKRSSNSGGLIFQYITATIPSQKKEKFFINANFSGPFHAIHQFFKEVKISKFSGNFLNKIKVNGDVSGRLHAEIPFYGDKIKAKGNIDFKNNSILIKPLDNSIGHINGSLYFSNGNITSSLIRASWLGQPISFTIITSEVTEGVILNCMLKSDWQPANLPGISIELAKYFRGYAHWTTKVFLKLSCKAYISYEIQMNADLRDISSTLPAPLQHKACREALPLVLNAKGNIDSFILSGNLGRRNYFSSEFILQKHGIKLARAVWRDRTSKVPELPVSEVLIFNLPAFNGKEWLDLINPELIKKYKQKSYSFTYPEKINFTTPKLTLAGQIWHTITFSASKLENAIHINIDGNELNGLVILNNNMIQANFKYLHYDPEWSILSVADNNIIVHPSHIDHFPFSKWLSIKLRCHDGWIMGQRLQQVNFDITPNREALTLNYGLINTGNTQLIFEGFWKQKGIQNYTFLKGNLKGSDITSTSDYFGFNSLPKKSPFNIKCDLNWIGPPWRPYVRSINGSISIELGKGEIDKATVGSVGQILRLVSVDALLRKLKLDFSDTFGNRFYYDSIRGNGKLSNGVLATHDLLIDGLSADIAMNGLVNFITRRISMQAIVAPDLSSTVGVATAFIINPIVGAAVFAGSKVLAPLWNKISLICYNITGSLGDPSINKVLCK
ncbi:YhdP family protein [Candidatus Profftia tarda]|uniref:Uncharacterized protein YhdP n=1 Tax=Candidatus Profftia tarda TaxID=1177216 RepID=A0A8E4F0Y5_9ENTR|nr:YhdP family protein [Candidatus Profftia tarda]CAD6507225.1 Uncharacterized protein YhdP [Candidatus Profftia tarda]